MKKNQRVESTLSLSLFFAKAFLVLVSFEGNEAIERPVALLETELKVRVEQRSKKGRVRKQGDKALLFFQF